MNDLPAVESERVRMGWKVDVLVGSLGERERDEIEMAAGSEELWDGVEVVLMFGVED